jgi:FtsH-binding integral membrane protein
MCNEADPASTRGEVLLALFIETNTEIRARRLAEYTYTGAAVAAFGGLAWGVAALSSFSGTRAVPTLAAVLAILVLTVSVALKIMDEHDKHYGLRKEVVRLARLVEETHKLEQGDLPAGFRCDPKPGSGHFYSLFILFAAGIYAAVFCMSIGFTAKVAIECAIGGTILICASLLWIRLLDKHKTS